MIGIFILISSSGFKKNPLIFSFRWFEINRECLCGRVSWPGRGGVTTQAAQRTSASPVRKPGLSARSKRDLVTISRPGSARHFNWFGCILGVASWCFVRLLFPWYRSLHCIHLQPPWSPPACTPPGQVANFWMDWNPSNVPMYHLGQQRSALARHRLGNSGSVSAGWTFGRPTTV